MHRILWALSAVLMTAGAAGPWFMGNVAEEQFHQSLAQVPKDNPFMQVTESTFERGYQNSQATVKLRYDLPNTESQPFTLVFKSDVQHSPLTYTDQGLLFLGIYSNDVVTLEGLSADAQAIYSQYLGGQILQGNTQVSLSGEYQSHLTRQMINAKNDVEPVEFEMGALALNLQGNIASGDFKMLLDMQPSKILTPEFEMHVSGVTTNSSLAKHNDSLYLGDTHVSVENIKIFNAGMPIDLNNFVISASNEVQSDKLNTKITYSVESIEAPLPVSSASYSFELNGVALNAVEFYQKLGLSSTDGSQPASFSPEQYGEELLQVLLQPGLQLNQELKVGAFGGDLLVDLDVEYKGLFDGASITEDTDPAQAISAVKANMLVKATTESVMQTPAAPMVEGFVQQGLIAQDGDELLSNVVLDDGKLSVNGTDIPLQPIIQGLMDKYVEQQLKELEQEEQMDQAEQQSSSL